MIGAGVAAISAFGAAYAFFKVLNEVMGIRVAPEVEVGGLDFAEVGAPAYWDGDEPVRGAWPAPALVPSFSAAGAD